MAQLVPFYIFNFYTIFLSESLLLSNNVNTPNNPNTEERIKELKDEIEMLENVVDQIEDEIEEINDTGENVGSEGVEELQAEAQRFIEKAADLQQTLSDLSNNF